MGDGFVVIVADPGFEQIAKNVERVRAGDLILQETKKTPGRGRAFVGEMQVCDEMAATCFPWRVQTISAFSITTSSSGTS